MISGKVTDMHVALLVTSLMEYDFDWVDEKDLKVVLVHWVLEF